MLWCLDPMHKNVPSFYHIYLKFEQNNFDYQNEWLRIFRSKEVEIPPHPQIINYLVPNLYKIIIIIIKKC